MSNAPPIYIEEPMEFDLDAPEEHNEQADDLNDFVPGDDGIGAPILDDEDECQCVRAVKVQNDEKHICQICGKNAYNSQYSFAHTDGGKKLLKDAGIKPIDPIVTIMAALPSVLEAFDLLATVPGVPPPPVFKEEKATRKRAPKVEKPKKVKPAKIIHPFLEAVEFIALAQKSKGEPMMTHCMIAYGGITAFDGVIAAGALIKEDDLFCIPNTEKLMLALSRCGEQYTIVQMDKQLYITSGDFSAYVPLTTQDQMVTAVPDPSIAPLDDRFRVALLTVGKLVKDSGATLLQSAVQLNPYTVIATNGQVIMEAMHGFDMPPTKMLVPRRFVDALSKTKKVIKSFGFAAETFTVHFEDRSWLRTNLYKGVLEVDLLSKIDVVPTYKKPVPANFFGAVEEVSKWSEDGRIHCFDNRISSHAVDKQNVGSCRTFSMDGFANDRIYSVQALKTISKVALSMDDTRVPGLTLFIGDKVRGAIMHDTTPKPKAPEPDWSFCIHCRNQSKWTASNECRNPACPMFGKYDDDDIPF